MNEDQRRALDLLIKSIVREDVGNDDSSAATSQAPGSGATVHELPSAEALDPTMPDDVAARTVTGKGRTQQARERQDKEAEEP